MKIIIPMAGKGTRLYPHTYSRPKPLVRVAGKPILAHLLDKLLEIDIEEIIFITGDMEVLIRSYIETNYSFKTRFIHQKDKLGPAHAISLAKKYVFGKDILIVFVDTVFEADLELINRCQSEGIIWVHEVENPSRFGVVIKDGKYIAKLKEKPKQPISKLAQIGLYYIKDSELFFKSIDYIIKNKMQQRNEYFLPPVFEKMIQEGAKLEAEIANGWYDCGTIQELLLTNKILLQKKNNEFEGKNTIIIPPNYIEQNVQISNSIIGPFVSIASGAKIENSIINNSIINENAIIENAILTSSLIGNNAVVEYQPKRFNVGDYSQFIG